MSACRLALAASLVACVVPAAAQDDPHANCAALGWVPREILERPVPLRESTGNAHEPVTTSSREAQALYDQGLNYLHGYVWIEAARSFRQALRADPKLAMAWLGLSRVYSGLDDPDEARAALMQAEALAGGASPREQRRIALRARQLEALADLADAARHDGYKKAIDEALAVDIGDAELWLVRGNAEEASAAGRGQRGGASSTAFYREALRLAPDNAAAHHYLTHSYETVSQIPLALEHGEAYARLAPAIPHAHHMWGHDLRRVGRIDDAIAAFRRTDELEKAYYAAEGIAPELDWHHVHNLDLLATAYQHKGQMRLAEATMREATALPPTTDYLEFQQKLLTVFLLGRQRWDEALAAAEPLASGKWSGTRAVGRALRGHALLARGRTAEAREALAAAERELAGVSALAAGIGVNRGQVQPWIDTLRGELLLREGAATDGRRILQDVARTLRAIPGPDAWIQALFRLEAMARLAREAGDWELAEFLARQMLEHDSAYGGSQLAAALVAEHRGDAAAAAAARAAALRYWRDADAGLPELALARGRTAGSRYEAEVVNRREVPR
jgi:tetratricopeptide (TPR) repeat protein